MQSVQSMSMKTNARCPEYNLALEALRKDCMNPIYLYGFDGKPFNEVQASVNEIIEDMLNIFEAKDTDYAANGKPMGNLRSAEELGIPAWKGTLLRMGDKKQRIQSFAARGSFKVNDEKIADTLKDLANYACLASVLFSEIYLTSTYGKQFKVEKILRDFHFLALRSIQCKALADCEMKYPNVIPWNEQPLKELLEHFDAIAAFARSN